MRIRQRCPLVSIRAPVRGRPLSTQRLAAARGFNPRPREGATTWWVDGNPAAAVSIRAPVRGRQEIQLAGVGVREFQSAPP